MHGNAYDATTERSSESAGCLRLLPQRTMSRRITYSTRKAQVPNRGRGAYMADDERKRRGEPGSPGTAVVTKTRPQTKRPNMYRVLILNDDYTPMEFVVHVLERFFNKDHEEA